MPTAKIKPFDFSEPFAEFAFNGVECALKCVRVVFAMAVAMEAVYANR